MQTLIQIRVRGLTDGMYDEGSQFLDDRDRFMEQAEELAKEIFEGEGKAAGIEVDDVE